MSSGTEPYTFAIVIEHDEDGYFAYCPQLQGCFTDGETSDEVRAKIADAIRLHVEDRLANGETIPRNDSVELSTVKIAV